MALKVRNCGLCFAGIPQISFYIRQVPRQALLARQNYYPTPHESSEHTLPDHFPRPNNFQHAHW